MQGQNQILKSSLLKHIDVIKCAFSKHNTYSLLKKTSLYGKNPTFIAEESSALVLSSSSSFVWLGGTYAYGCWLTVEDGERICWPLKKACI